MIMRRQRSTRLLLDGVSQGPIAWCDGNIAGQSAGAALTMEGSETSHASGNYNFNGAVNLPIIDGVLAMHWAYDMSYHMKYQVKGTIVASG